MEQLSSPASLTMPSSSPRSPPLFMGNHAIHSPYQLMPICIPSGCDQEIAFSFPNSNTASALNWPLTVYRTKGSK